MKSKTLNCRTAQVLALMALKKQDYLEENRTLKRKKQDFDVRNSTEFGTDCKTDSIKETIIDIIRANPESSYSDLVSKTGVSRRTIAKVIKDLSDAGIIKRQGQEETELGL